MTVENPSDTAIAILDGRFLPLEHFEITRTDNIDTQQMGLGQGVITTTRPSTELIIVTRRNPKLRNLHEWRSPVHIYHEDKHIEISDIMRATIDTVGTEIIIEMVADGYTINRR